MTTRFYFRPFAALSGVLLFLTGCSSGPPRPADMPPLFSTSITVVQEGVPLEGAEVSLFSDDASFKWTVVGTTNASGKANLMTHAQFSGAPLGTYKVVINKTEQPDGGVPFFPDNEEGQRMRAEHEKMASQGKITQYTLVEKKYTDVKSTPLTITIEPRTNNEQFEVGKPVKEVKAIIEM